MGMHEFKQELRMIYPKLYIHFFIESSRNHGDEYNSGEWAELENFVNEIGIRDDDNYLKTFDGLWKYVCDNEIYHGWWML